MSARVMRGSHTKHVCFSSEGKKSSKISVVGSHTSTKVPFEAQGYSGAIAHTRGDPPPKNANRVFHEARTEWRRRREVEAAAAISSNEEATA